MIELTDIVRQGGQAVALRAAQPAPLPLAQVMAILRPCAGELGLSAQVLRSLETLLSCLAPKRNHHIVFASNATLVERAGGLSERSLRRHIAVLVELGFVERHDSPNGKRYICHDPLAGQSLRFGLDFAPLFAQLPRLQDLALACSARARQNHYLRRKLRAACHRLLQLDPENTFALAAAKAARRKLGNEELVFLIEQLPEITCSETMDMAATDGQNDRHQSNLSTEQIDISEDQQLGILLDHCDEAQSFALTKVQSKEEAIALAESLAPMIGINAAILQRAKERHESFDLAALIWFILQRLRHIAKPAAYFYAATLGPKASHFAPWEWLKRLAGQNCPRTI